RVIVCGGPSGRASPDPDELHDLARSLGIAGAVRLRAAAEVIRRHPEENIRVIVCGGPSGRASPDPDELHDLARSLGIAGAVRLRAADRPHAPAAP
ncbi:hypothetical protein MTQ19_01800, partial [Corynebacterium bovis]